LRIAGAQPTAAVVGFRCGVGSADGVGVGEPDSDGPASDGIGWDGFGLGG
jgi:hypothetical protein